MMLWGFGGVGFVHRPQFGFGRLAMLAAMMIAAAGLSGCGRKGSLDLPPTAAISSPQQTPPGPSLGEQSDSPAHSFEPPPPAPQTAPPPPPPGARRWFPLDFLIR
jgi:predicted small lipoprotein YifL